MLYGVYLLVYYLFRTISMDKHHASPDLDSVLGVMAVLRFGWVFSCLYIYVTETCRGSDFYCTFNLFLGAFAKLLKAIISLIMSVCPSICLSVRTEQLGSQIRIMVRTRKKL